MAQLKDPESGTDTPSELAPAIRLARELETLREVGAHFGLNDISEGAWAALIGLREGRARAEEEMKADQRESN